MVLKQQQERKQLVGECQELEGRLASGRKELETAQAEAAEVHRQLERLKLGHAEASEKAKELAKEKTSAEAAAKAARGEYETLHAKCERRTAPTPPPHLTCIPCPPFTITAPIALPCPLVHRYEKLGAAGAKIKANLAAAKEQLIAHKASAHPYHPPLAYLLILPSSLGLPPCRPPPSSSYPP